MIRFYCLFFLITLFISCKHKEQKNEKNAVLVDTSVSDNLRVDNTILLKDSIGKQKLKRHLSEATNNDIDTFYKTDWGEIIYTSSKELPELGFPDLYQYLIKNIIYPNEAFDNPKKYIKRRVYISFQVTNKGIRNVKVIKGMEKHLDSNCVRALKRYSPFVQCKQLGKSAKARIVIPIEFKEVDVGYVDNQIDSNYLKFEDNLVVIRGVRHIDRPTESK